MSNTAKKVAVIIDHSNFRHMWQELRSLHEYKQVNYTKLVNLLVFPDVAFYKVVFLNRAVAGDALCRFFDKNGYETLEKKAKRIYDTRTGVSYKCNLDVDIAIVVMQMIFDREMYNQRPDKIIIVSGDSDFEGLGHVIIDYKMEVQFAFFGTGFAKELREKFNCRVIDKMSIYDKAWRKQA
ncbi:MAG: NYN domain-containing protein [bacterium]